MINVFNTLFHSIAQLIQPFLEITETILLSIETVYIILHVKWYVDSCNSAPKCRHLCFLQHGPFQNVSFQSGCRISRCISSKTRVRRREFAFSSPRNPKFCQGSMDSPRWFVASQLNVRPPPLPKH